MITDLTLKSQNQSPKPTLVLTSVPATPLTHVYVVTQHVSITIISKLIIILGNKLFAPDQVCSYFSINPNESIVHTPVEEIETDNHCEIDRQQHIPL
jgi:hypothetical protein